MATKKKSADQNKAAEAPKKKFSELVIKEVMVQKNVSREEALHILENPTQPEAAEEKDEETEE